MDKDRLDNLWIMQKEIESRFFDPSLLNTAEKAKWTKEFCLAIVREMGELLDSIPFTKHWKVTQPPLDRENVVVELIDLAHFLLALCILWEVSPEEFMRTFTQKHQENINRYESGY